MNREIKFRGKSVETGEWAYGCLVNNLWCHSIYSSMGKAGSGIIEIIPDNPEHEITCWQDVEDSLVQVDPDSVGQYVGLNDRNGNMIYEGDAVRVLYTDWASKNSSDTRSLDEYLDSISETAIVRIWGPETGLQFSSDSDYLHSIHVGKHGRITIIGNLFDNPELLKQ